MKTLELDFNFTELAHEEMQSINGGDVWEWLEKQYKDFKKGVVDAMEDDAKMYDMSW